MFITAINNIFVIYMFTSVLCYIYYSFKEFSICNMNSNEDWSSLIK